MAEARKSGCCGSCYWFYQDPDEYEGEDDLQWGDCCVDPPTADFAEEGACLGVWPLVHAEHPHCGKYIKTHNNN